jgi:hypothetical protein
LIKEDIMRKLIFILFVLAVLGTFLSTHLISATPENVMYRVAAKLVKVERTPALEQETKIKGWGLWNDNMIETNIFTHPEGIEIFITNKKTADMIINWDKCWLLDAKGEKRPLTIQGKTIEKEKGSKLLKLKIPVNGKEGIQVIPTDYMKNQGSMPPIGGRYGVEQSQQVFGPETIIVPIFKQTYNENEVKKITDKNKDHPDFKIDTFITQQTFDMVLNIDIDGTRYVYRFYFVPSILNL